MWTPLDPDLFTYDFPVENFNPFALQGNHVMIKPEELYQRTRPWKDEGFPAWVRGMIFMDGRPAPYLEPAAHILPPDHGACRQTCRYRQKRYRQREY